MNISGLVGTLVPVFFVLALGYFAGKRNTFDARQVAGFSKLAMSFALPAALFVGMMDIRRDLLLQQGRLVLALILAHIGLFLVAWIVLRRVKSLRGTPSIIYSLLLATSGTPVFGLAVLEPVLGTTSAGAVGLVALAIYLTVALAVVFLEIDAAAKNRGTRTDRSKPRLVMTGLKGGLKSPLLWGPVLGIAVVLAKVHFALCGRDEFRVDWIRHFRRGGLQCRSGLSGLPGSPFGRGLCWFPGAGHGAIGNVGRSALSTFGGKPVRTRGASVM
jgi:predicted permease